MTSLHLINKSSDHPRFSACLAAAGNRDRVLLMENAVTALADTNISWPETITIYALDADMKSRGLDQRSFPVPVEQIDYSTFVALTLEADKVVSW